MNVKEATFHKRKKLDEQLRFGRYCPRPAGRQVKRVLTHEHGHFERLGRLQTPDGNADVTPTARPVRHQFAGNTPVEVEKQFLVQGVTVEGGVNEDFDFDQSDTLG